MDLFGRKVYATAGLQLRIANQQAILRRYNFNSWASTLKFKELVPMDSSAEFVSIVEEGKAVAQTSLTGQACFQTRWTPGCTALKTPRRP